MVAFSIFLEIILRLCAPLLSNYHMEMWRYARELKTISFYNDLPFEHAVNKKSSLYGVEIRTNSLGLRAEKDYILPKPRNIKRVLVLGDSITMGWGAEFKDIYTSRLEALLNKNALINYEVINTAVGNYNSVCELWTLRKYLGLQPDFIILGFYINDLEDVPRLSRLNYLIRKHSFLYAFISARIINIKHRFSYKKYYNGLYEDKKLTQRAKKAISEMIEIANSNSIPFVFLNIPELHGFKDYYFKETQRFVQDIAKDHPEIVLIDLLDVLGDIEAEEFWVSSEDPHPNVDFHKIIAMTIYRRLQYKGLI